MGADGGEFRFSEDPFDARKNAIFLEANVVVQYAAQVDRRGRDKLSAERLLQIRKSGANFRVIGEHAHHFEILVEAGVAGVVGQKHLFFFGKMGLTAVLPKMDQRFGESTQLSIALR